MIATAPLADVFALEDVAARSWPAAETARLGGWALRATAGWTKRANSARPLGPDVLAADPTASTSALGAVADWYDARGLPPTLALPDPPYGEASAQLAAAGWTPIGGALTLVAELDVLTALRPGVPDRTSTVVTTEPDAAWLDRYRGGGAALPPHARRLLTAADARFLGLRLDGSLIGVARLVVDDGWVGLSAMQVAPASRRRGVGTELLRAAAAAARELGAVRAWLQVEPDAVAARALYDRAGFVPHHRYTYLRRAQERP